MTYREFMSNKRHTIAYDGITIEMYDMGNNKTLILTKLTGGMRQGREVICKSETIASVVTTTADAYEIYDYHTSKDNMQCANYT